MKAAYNCYLWQKPYEIALSSQDSTVVFLKTDEIVVVLQQKIIYLAKYDGAELKIKEVITTSGSRGWTSSANLKALA